MRLPLQVSHVMQVLACFSGQQSLRSLPKSTGIEMIFFLAMTERCLNPKHQRNTPSEEAGDHPGCLCLLKNEVSSASITCHASEIGAKKNGARAGYTSGTCVVCRVSPSRAPFFPASVTSACYAGTRLLGGSNKMQSCC